MSYQRLLLSLFIVFAIVSSSGVGLQNNAWAVSPHFQTGGGQDEVRVDVDPPVPLGNGRYQLEIYIDNPDKVAALEIVVDNAGIKELVPVLGQSEVVYTLDMSGQEKGEYMVRIRALDGKRRYFERQGHGSGGPRDLAITKVMYEPEMPEKPSFEIISVNPDFERKQLIIQLDVVDTVEIATYEGFILNSANNEVAKFSAPFPGPTISMSLPQALAEAAGEYKLRVYLWGVNGVRSDPQELEFKVIPPPEPSFWKKIIHALKANPGILAGIGVILLSLILWILVKNKKDKKVNTLPRPPIERTNFQYSPGSTPRPPHHPYQPRSYESHFGRSDSFDSSAPAHASHASPRPVSPNLSHSSPQEEWNVPASSHRLQLKLLQSPNYVGPKQIIIAKFPYTIGRVKSDLVFSDKQLSRHHLKIFVKQNELFLMDLGSTNGTYINGQQLPASKPYAITKKITVRLGRATVFDLIPL